MNKKYSMLTKNCILPLLSILFILSFHLNGQNYLSTQEKVESHRIQYENFDWKYLTNKNFEVYFYGKNDQLAQETLDYAIAESSRISKILGYFAYNKVKIFIHNSPFDLIQDNSGITTSSNTELIQANRDNFKIQLAFESSLDSYKKRLTENLANIYLNDMLFGGSIRESFQNTLLLNVSEWFSKGLVAYLVDGENPAMNQFMVQAIREGKLRKLSLAKGEEAKLIGQSIFAYVGKVYGNQVISNVVNYTRIIRSEQSSFTSAIKKSFSTVLQDWYKYYFNKQIFYQQVVQPIDSNLLKTYSVRLDDLIEYQVNPEGNYLAYIQLTNSKLQGAVQPLNSTKKVIFYQETRNEMLEYESIQIPLIRWGKNNTFYMLIQDKAKSWIYSYQLEKDKVKFLQKKPLGDLEIYDFQMDKSGKKLLVKINKNGQFDLGFVDLNRTKFSAITNTKEEESQAQFFGDNNGLVYVAPSTDSTLSQQENAQLKSVFYWDSDLNDGPVKLFSHIGTIHQLQNLDEKNWLFLNSKSNFQNLIIRHIDSTHAEEILGPTNSWLSYHLVKDQVFFANQHILEKNYQSLPIQELLKLKRSNYIPELMVINGKEDEIGKLIQSNKDSTNIVREDYYSKKTLQRLERLQKKIDILDQIPGDAHPKAMSYINKFLFNGSKSDFQVDPFRGLGGKMEFLFNDFLENHLIKFGGWTNVAVNTIDLWSEYQYLAKKLDYSFRYDRKNIIQKYDFDGQKVRYNQIKFEVSKPFNLYNKLSIAAIFTNNRAIDVYNLPTPEINWAFLGGKIEYKLENVISKNQNEMEGQRLRLWLDANFGLNKSSLSFSKINLDYRKYLPINRIFSFRGRFSSSIGFGSRVPQSMLGGMDNWIFIQREPRNNDNPLGYEGSVVRPDVFMSNVVGPLRGFNINKYSGSSHILLNAQVAVSVRELLGNTNPSSEFGKYLQIIGFFDVGTAWTGPSPFTKYNGFNTNIYGGNNNPFTVKVTDFRNPFLMGVGMGARTRLLGFYVKYDYAIGIENKEFNTPISYLTIGHDF